MMLTNSSQLRHLRYEPPSLEEQRSEVARQERIKVLAQAADARWEAKPRLAGSDGVAAVQGQSLPGVGNIPVMPRSLEGSRRDKEAAENKTRDG
jgi:NADH dehydrogenase [ubiquinone] 1 alpha subcomplex assembly factor 2